MEQLNAMAMNRLVSFERSEEIAKMNKEEKIAFNN